MNLSLPTLCMKSSVMFSVSVTLVSVLRLFLLFTQGKLNIPRGKREDSSVIVMKYANSNFILIFENFVCGTLKDQSCDK